MAESIFKKIRPSRKGKARYACESCGADLMKQEGFDPERYPTWMCTKCYHFNYNIQLKDQVSTEKQFSQSLEAELPEEDIFEADLAEKLGEELDAVVSRDSSLSGRAGSAASTGPSPVSGGFASEGTSQTSGGPASSGPSQASGGLASSGPSQTSGGPASSGPSQASGGPALTGPSRPSNGSGDIGSPEKTARQGIFKRIISGPAAAGSNVVDEDEEEYQDLDDTNSEEDPEMEEEKTENGNPGNPRAYLFGNDFIKRYGLKWKMIFLIVVLMFLLLLGAYFSEKSSFTIGYDYHVFIGQSKDTVEDQLTEAGYEKITFEALNDLTVEDALKQNTVARVTIGGNSRFTKDTKTHKTSKVVVLYHDFIEYPVPESSSRLRGQNYSDVESLFSDAGFTNIQTVPIYDLTLSILNKPGEVESITIGDDDHFRKDDLYTQGTLIVISYHLNREDDPALQTEE